MDVQLDGITVTLYDRLDFQRATTVTKAVAFIDEDDPAIRPAVVLATLSEFYVLMGVKSWSIKEPVTSANIRRLLLTRDDIGILVEAADSLYQEQILLPLLARAQNSSPPSQTVEPTSPMPPGAKRPQKQSKPSLTSITPTDGTATTSPPPDGAYSSSQNLELAG